MNSSAPLWLIRFWPAIRRLIFPEWLFNRRVRTTRPGYVFLFLIIAVSGAAFNTGNNLLYLVLAMMLAALLSSFMASEYMIAQIHVTRDPPELVTAGLTFRVSYQFRNDKNLIPSFNVRLSELLGETKVTAVMAYAAAGQEFMVKSSAIAERRGRIKFHDLNISTTAPFGWFHKSKRVPLAGEIIALPRTDPREVDRDLASALGEERPRRKPGHGDQLFGFRKYVRGDPVKGIHWKTSARSGELMVLEREAEEERKLRIELKLSTPNPPVPDPLREAAVRRAASLAEAALNEGWQVRVEANGKGLDFGHGPGHLHNILVFLALFDDPDKPFGRVLPPSEAPAIIL